MFSIIPAKRASREWPRRHVSFSFLSSAGLKYIIDGNECSITWQRFIYFLLLLSLYVIRYQYLLPILYALYYCAGVDDRHRIWIAQVPTYIIPAASSSSYRIWNANEYSYAFVISFDIEGKKFRIVIIYILLYVQGGGRIA